jgi:excisionase family DNA binding protein
MTLVVEGINLYTVMETAKALHVTPQTVRRLIRKGKLKGQRIGRPILISENSLRQFLNGGAGE